MLDSQNFKDRATYKVKREEPKQLELDFFRGEAVDVRQVDISSPRDKGSEITKDKIRVIKIRRKIAREFYRKYHYTKGCSNNAMSYGVYHSVTYDLLACVSIQVPCSENVRASILGEAYKSNVAELGRLAIKQDINISASMILPIVINTYIKERHTRGMHPIYALVSYADSEQGHHGGVYQAMSWIYTGSFPTSKAFYKDDTGRIRHPRQNTKNISKVEARAKGWSVIVKAGIKYRYIKMISGSKRFRRKILKGSRYQSLPYPKPGRLKDP